MAPRSTRCRSPAGKKIGRSKSDLCNRGSKQSIRDMMAKVTGSCVIEMTFFGQGHPNVRKGEGLPHHNGSTSRRGSRSEPDEHHNLEDMLYQPKRFPVLGPTRQDTELFFSLSKARSGPVCESSAGERKRDQSNPSPVWQDQAPSRAPSRGAVHPITVPDVTRIDIYPDSNGNPATRCSEHIKTGAALTLTAKPPRSNFTRPVDHGSRNSSAQRRLNRASTSSTSAPQPSRSADAAKSRKGQIDNFKETRQNGASERDIGNDENDDGYNDDGDDGSGVYCVIRSGVTPRARTRRQVTGALTKHQFRQVCSRPHQAVVFTADTASLLLRSGPPLLIRPAADISLHRQAARSAIQRVTDVNYLTELHGIPRSKSGIESSSRRGQDQFRSRLALGRNSASKSVDVKQPHQDTPLLKEKVAPTGVLQRAASEEIVCRTESAGLKKKRLDTQQVAYISRDSSVASRHNQSFTGPHTRSEPSTSATSLNMATRQKLKNPLQQPHQKSRPTHKAEAATASQKTLIPSKHGFHPRSHSPTFKRLVAASERLQEVQPDTKESSVNAASVSSYPIDSYCYGSSSSDSLRDMRTTLSQDQVNGILNADYDSNNNSIGRGNHCKKDANSSSPNYLKERNSRTKQRQHTLPGQQPPPPVVNNEERRGRGAVREARLFQKKGQSHVTRQRHDVSFDRQHQRRNLADDTTSCNISGPSNTHNREPQVRPRRTSRLPCPEDGERVPPPTPPLTGHCGVEMEARVREGQPTQLHFFLPQLADGMSDGSGGNLTGRSNYREKRLELLDWRDSRSSGSDGGFHHGSSVTGPGGTLHCENDENDPTSSTTITEIQKHNRSNTKSKHVQYQKDTPSNRTNGYRGGSRERITAYDLKNGHLTLNRGRQSPQARDEGVGLSQPHKQKRHVSPIRAQKAAEKPVRNRRASNSPYRAPVYLESQLPSEKLKKQIEDFPTLVSMDYSDTDTSLQVR